MVYGSGSSSGKPYLDTDVARTAAVMAWDHFVFIVEEFELGGIAGEGNLNEK
jgi:hypothetical protein